MFRRDEEDEEDEEGYVGVHFEDRSVLFEGFPSSFWEAAGEFGTSQWLKHWTWMKEDGTAVNLEDTFGGDAGKVSSLLARSLNHPSLPLS